MMCSLSMPKSKELWRERNEEDAIDIGAQRPPFKYLYTNIVLYICDVIVLDLFSFCMVPQYYCC